MAKLRMAFIGCGSQASLLQANIALIDAIDFVATCDLVAEKAQRNARRFGAKDAYTDFREMIEAEKPDAVGICGPPQMHHEVGMACLESGCHVFMEKPPATSAAETRQLVEAARQTGRFGMVATHWRHAPAHRMARQLAEDEGFSKVLGFRCKYAAPGPKSAIWGLDSVVRSFLLGQAIHPVDCMRFLVGSEVESLYATIAEEHDGTTSFAITFRFENGAVGTLNLFGGTHTLMMETAIIGASGRCVEVEEAARLRYLKEQPPVGAGGYADTPAITWHQRNLYRGYARPGYIEELEHFAGSLLEGRQPRSSLEDAYRDMAILEAIIESARSGEAVRLAYQ